MHSPTHGCVAVQTDTDSSFSAVSSSAELRKTFPSVQSFPVVVPLTLVFTFQYICTMCSTNITSVLLTTNTAPAQRADKQTDQLSHREVVGERVFQAQILLLHAVKFQDKNYCRL